MAATIPKSFFSSLAVHLRKSAYVILNYSCHLLNAYQVANTSNPVSWIILPNTLRMENFYLTSTDGEIEAQDSKLIC